uniref:SpaS n=1 Tax=Spirochaeta aurantia TaxID=147 RepID=Q0PHY7_SPIAU|nr:SpaS [Spirochaeta aurantia]
MDNWSLLGFVAAWKRSKMRDSRRPFVESMASHRTTLHTGIEPSRRLRVARNFPTPQGCWSARSVFCPHDRLHR